jgi:MATE family multidrug resistance protein
VARSILRGRRPSAWTVLVPVVALAAGLLAWLALYHIGDATQAVCVFVLRCYRVAVAPLVAYCVLLWGAGLAGGYVLAYRGIGPLPAMQSPAAFWIASALALLVLALVLPVILWQAVRSWPVAASSPATGRAEIGS